MIRDQVEEAAQDRRPDADSSRPRWAAASARSARRPTSAPRMRATSRRRGAASGRGRARHRPSRRSLVGFAPPASVCARPNRSKLARARSRGRPEIPERRLKAGWDGDPGPPVDEREAQRWLPIWLTRRPTYRPAAAEHLTPRGPRLPAARDAADARPRGAGDEPVPAGQGPGLVLRRLRPGGGVGRSRVRDGAGGSAVHPSPRPRGAPRPRRDPRADPGAVPRPRGRHHPRA